MAFKGGLQKLNLQVWFMVYYGFLPNRLLLQILNFGCKLQTAPPRILAK